MGPGEALLLLVMLAVLAALTVYWFRQRNNINNNK